MKKVFNFISHQVATSENKKQKKKKKTWWGGTTTFKELSPILNAKNLEQQELTYIVHRDTEWHSILENSLLTELNVQL